MPTTSLARTAQAYRDHLTVERGLAPNSLSAYSRDLRRYLEFCAGRGITAADQVTESDLGDFLAWLRQGSAEHPPLAAASAARTLVAVRGFHRFAVEEGVSATDPGREVKPPSAAKRLPKALTIDEVEAILTSTGGVAAEPLGLRDRALLEFLYGTGARISEAIGLDADDLEVEDAVALLHGKGGKQRLVPIGSKAGEALSAYMVRARPALLAGAQPAVFLNARGGRLSRQSAWTILRVAADRAGVRADVSPHTLRHSFATHLLDGGADVRVVQELLGHASVTTTQVYTKVTVEHLREVYALAHPRARD
ncbi:MAG: site-specific tyrosine recombinase XerD [Actinomycetota bacterium]|nr:site-specific tyrosine recombinase XerD [Actinomycetota bacterium]